MYKRQEFHLSPRLNLSFSEDVSSCLRKKTALVAVAINKSEKEAKSSFAWREKKLLRSWSSFYGTVFGSLALTSSSFSFEHRRSIDQLIALESQKGRKEKLEKEKKKD